MAHQTSEARTLAAACQPRGLEDFSLQHLSWLMEVAPQTETLQIEEQFTAWRIVVDALPLASDDYCFVTNWLRSARTYWEKREINASQFQIHVLVKRLRALFPEKFPAAN